MKQALGIVETKGLEACIEATEAIAISTLGKERKQNGSVSMLIMVRGEEELVRQAIEAGTSAARKLGQVTNSSVITVPGAKTLRNGECKTAEK